MTLLFSSSTRKLLLAVSSPCRVYSRDGGHAYSTRMTPHKHSGEVKPLSRNVKISPISRNEVKEIPQGRRTITLAEDKATPPEPRTPLAGHSAGGQFSTGSTPANTLIATTVGLGTCKFSDMHCVCMLSLHRP